MSDESAPTPPAPSGIRASDADREQLISELNEHMVAGRLGTDELEQRTQAAYAARSTTELDALRRDLPPTKAQLARNESERRRHLTRRMIQETGGSAIAFVVATGVWVASGANGQFWPVWVLLVVLIVLARNAWSLFGPAADLDQFERELDQRRQRRLEQGHGRHRPRDR